MSNIDVIYARKYEGYQSSLSNAEQERLPDKLAETIDLTDFEMLAISGGGNERFRGVESFFQTSFLNPGS